MPDQKKIPPGQVAAAILVFAIALLATLGILAGWRVVAVIIVAIVVILIVIVAIGGTAWFKAGQTAHGAK